jgi:periplasmic protein TonB
MATATLPTAFESPRRALPKLAVVIAMHALALFALVSGDRILLTIAPQMVTLLATVPPEIIKPPPPPPAPPQSRTSKQQAPAREGAAPPLRDIEVPPRTDIAATIADTALQVEVAGGKPEGTGTAGAGNTGTGTGGASVRTKAQINPDNCERPTLPAYAERSRVAGHVILKVLIDVDGKVTDARIVKTSGAPILDKTALEGALHCRFVAATVDKVPVPSWELFRFSWTN